jgi:hypothetical protein
MTFFESRTLVIFAYHSLSVLVNITTQLKWDDSAFNKCKSRVDLTIHAKLIMEQN